MNLHDSVDGILLVNAFPCSLDSMTDDAIIRCIKGKPVLNLTVDAQTATAGLETRIFANAKSTRTSACPTAW